MCIRDSSRLRWGVKWRFPLWMARLSVGAVPAEPGMGHHIDSHNQIPGRTAVASHIPLAPDRNGLAVVNAGGHFHVNLLLPADAAAAAAGPVSYTHLDVYKRQLLDLNAVAQCTPGVIAVNTATFCGYRVHGLSGSLLATLGVLVPPMIIVTIISAFFWSFAENPWVQHALTGVRACVCALIINSTIRLYRKAVLDLPTFLVFLLSLIHISSGPEWSWPRPG